MSLVVLSRQSGKNFGDIVENILAMLGIPNILGRKEKFNYYLR